MKFILKILVPIICIVSILSGCSNSSRQEKIRNNNFSEEIEYSIRNELQLFSGEIVESNILEITSLKIKKVESLRGIELLKNLSSLEINALNEDLKITKLKDLKNIKHLTLERMNLNKSDLEIIQSMLNLQELTMFECKIEGDLILNKNIKKIDLYEISKGNRLTLKEPYLLQEISINNVDFKEFDLNLNKTTNLKRLTIDKSLKLKDCSFFNLNNLIEYIDIDITNLDRNQLLGLKELKYIQKIWLRAEETSNNAKLLNKIGIILLRNPKSENLKVSIRTYKEKAE